MQLADSGVFTCVAASPAGVADRNFTVLVLGMGQGDVGGTIGCDCSSGCVWREPWGILI